MTLAPFLRLLKNVPKNNASAFLRVSIDNIFRPPCTSASTTQKVEKRIVLNHFEKFGVDIVKDKIQDYTETLIAWADIIRKTFYDDGVDEIISTRRLVHIVNAYNIFENKMWVLIS